eukprot:10114460-Lingulodinium_polyedra.AAC.1
MKDLDVAAAFARHINEQKVIATVQALQDAFVFADLPVPMAPPRQDGPKADHPGQGAHDQHDASPAAHDQPGAGPDVAHVQHDA